MQWFDRYIFFQDKVQLHNQTETTGTFSLIGPQSEALLAKLGWAIPSVQHGHEAIAFQDHSITIARGSGLASEGFTLIFDRDIAKALWSALTEAGAIALGDSSWETLRIQQGRPKADAELTEDFNPLEAGLWHLISLDKGCYIGQETIARLNTYNGVKQNLWGLVLPEPIEVGEPITLNEKKVGVVTSCIQTSSGGVGLGYVKSKAGQAGSTVQISGMGVTLREVPFLTRAIATEQ
jgi:folate-binding protein YgfZ